MHGNEKERCSNLTKHLAIGHNNFIIIIVIMHNNNNCNYNVIVYHYLHLKSMIMAEDSLAFSISMPKHNQL